MEINYLILQGFNISRTVMKLWKKSNLLSGMSEFLSWGLTNNLMWQLMTFRKTNNRGASLCAALDAGSRTATIYKNVYKSRFVSIYFGKRFKLSIQTNINVSKHKVMSNFFFNFTDYSNKIKVGKTLYIFISKNIKKKTWKYYELNTF